jgi:hypothetical protein
MNESLRYAHPDNGWAYSPIELEAIWRINVDTTDIVLGPLQKRHAYFDYEAKNPRNPFREGDRLTRNLIGRAILAEFHNSDPE